MSRHYKSKSGAIRARGRHGGWVIQRGYRDWWWTNDEGTAVDLVLPLTREDRAMAKRLVASRILIN